MSGDWERRRKVVALPGMMSPHALAATALDKAQQGEVRHYVQIITWKDGSVSCAWSAMPLSSLVYSERIFGREVDQELARAEEP